MMNGFLKKTKNIIKMLQFIWPLGIIDNAEAPIV